MGERIKMSEEARAFEASLGFRIRYPNLEGFKSGENSKGLEFTALDVESGGDHKSIVVVLLGWYGADYKYLGKYSEMYLQKGCVVLECITPVKVLSLKKNKIPMVAHRIVTTLEEYHLEYNPMFFHVFSNAGSWVYSYVIKELARLCKTKELDVRGTIFDSAPFPLSAFGVFRTMLAFFSAKFFFPVTYPLALMVTLLWIAETSLEHLLLFFHVCYNGDWYEKPKVNEEDQTEVRFPTYNFLSRICGIRNHNFLFLYSEKDEITPWEDVEKIAFTLQSRDNSVELVKFEGSQHVQHFRNFPQEYVADIWSFLFNQMEKETRPQVYWY